MSNTISDLKRKARQKRYVQIIIAPILYALTALVLTASNQNVYATLLYVTIVSVGIAYLFHREQVLDEQIEVENHRALEESERQGWLRRQTFEHADEVISPSLFSLFGQLTRPVPGDEGEFIESYINDLLEDLTTRVFEADVRAATSSTELWSGQSFKSTLMTKQKFDATKHADVIAHDRVDPDLAEEIKSKKGEEYQALVNKNCMMISNWYYPGGAHPGSLGVPYDLGKTVAGFAWSKKSLVVWTPTKACTPTKEVDPKIFAEKYQGQLGKYQSMVCVAVESLEKNKQFAPPSDTVEDGVLGILTITCERKDYLQPTVDFAKYLQTLLAPYVSILSYALERMVELSKNGVSNP